MSSGGVRGSGSKVHGEGVENRVVRFKKRVRALEKRTGGLKRGLRVWEEDCRFKIYCQSKPSDSCSLDTSSGSVHGSGSKARPGGGSWKRVCGVQKEGPGVWKEDCRFKIYWAYQRQLGNVKDSDSSMIGENTHFCRHFIPSFPSVLWVQKLSWLLSSPIGCGWKRGLVAGNIFCS